MSPYSYIKFLANLRMWSRQKVQAFPKKIKNTRVEYDTLCVIVFEVEKSKETYSIHYYLPLARYRSESRIIPTRVLALPVS